MSVKLRGSYIIIYDPLSQTNGESGDGDQGPAGGGDDTPPAGQGHTDLVDLSVPCKTVPIDHL